MLPPNIVKNVEYPSMFVGHKDQKIQWIYWFFNNESQCIFPKGATHLSWQWMSKGPVIFSGSEGYFLESNLGGRSDFWVITILL